MASSFHRHQVPAVHARADLLEKATAIHVFCLQERVRGERLPLAIGTMLFGSTRPRSSPQPWPIGNSSAVARHKSMFFAEKTADGTLVDYDRAVHGGYVSCRRAKRLRR